MNVEWILSEEFTKILELRESPCNSYQFLTERESLTNFNGVFIVFCVG